MSFRQFNQGAFGKIVVWVVVVAFGAGVLLLFTPDLGISFNQHQNEAMSNETALTVNGDEITVAEFEEAYNNLVQNYTQFYSQFGQNFSQRLQGPDGAHYQLELRSQVQDQLVRQALLDQEIEQRDITVPGDQVESEFQARLNEILAQNDLTEQEADDILRQQGSSLSQFKRDLREQIANQMRRDRLQEVVTGEVETSDEELIGFVSDNPDRFRSALTEQVEPSDEQIQAYYEANRDEYTQVHARHILIQVAEDAPEDEVEAARARIEGVQAQLAEGVPFAELAPQYSEDASNAGEGGDLGFFGRGQMVAPFEEVAFALEPGTISDPVRTRFGFHLIRVEERQVQPLDEVRSQITSSLQEEQRQEAFDQLLERAKAGDEEALGTIRAEVEDDYVSEQQQEQFEDWYEDYKEQADIQSELPLIQAFRLESEDKQEALAVYEQIKAEGTASDPYLDYYIGDLYRQRYQETSNRVQTLENQDELSAEEQQELDELKTQVESFREQAAEHLMAVAESESRPSLSLYQQVMDLGQDNAELRYKYALALMQNNDRSGAISQLRRAIEQEPEHVQSLNLYGDLMMENDNFQLAIEQYEKALESSDPESRTTQSIQLKLAQAYLGADNFERAQELFQTVLDNDERNTTALTGLGDLHFEQGDHAGAQDFYQRALNITPRADVRVKLGNALFEQGEVDEAKSAFEQAKKQSPYNVDAYEGLGKVFVAQEQPEKALEEYEEGFRRANGYEARRALGEAILALNPEDEVTRFKLADLYRGQHVYEKAIEHYKALLEQDPESIAAYKGLAESYSGRTDYESALTYYESALALDPPADDQIELYGAILDTQRRISGGDNPLGESGLEAMFQLAQLHMDRGQTEQAQGYLDDLAEAAPDFRADDVADLRQRVEDVASNKPGESVEIMGANHVQEGMSHGGHNSVPATSGPHYGREAEWGIHAEAVPDELTVHNLEHGGIAIQYRPDLDEATVAELTSLARELGPTYRKLIVAPYPGLDSAIALTAWGRIDKFERFNADRIRAFVAEYVDQGPEQIGYTGSDWWTAATPSGGEGDE